MHMQPAFSGCRVRGGAVSERLFERGLCLPSGSSLSQKDRERVVDTIEMWREWGAHNPKTRDSPQISNTTAGTLYLV